METPSTFGSMTYSMRSRPSCLRMVASNDAKRRKRVFVLEAVALVAVGFFVFGRMFGGLDLFQREHRLEMLDPGEAFGGRAADALAWAIPA